MFEKLVNAFEVYKNTFEGKRFVFYSKFNVVEVEFRKQNFLHLTGIKTKLTAKNFYRMLEHNRLSINDIKSRNDGTTEQKMNVIDQMPLLLKKCQITNDCSMIVNFELDSIIKTNKVLLAVGVFNKTPKTLLNIKRSRFNSNDFENVDCIEVYCIKTNELTEIIKIS